MRLFKSLFAFLLIAFSIQSVQGQALGTWRPYMAYQNATMIEAASDGYIYAVYDGSLLRYSPASGNALGETKLMSKVDGLNDVTIVQMAYVEAEKILVFVYDTGNIDLYDIENGDIYNIADFMNKASDITVNGIDVYGGFAYISMNSGILAVDTKNKVLKDTYNLSRKTKSVYPWGDYIYAATDEGIYRANKDGNLLTAANWDPYFLSYPGNPASIAKILTYKDYFVFYGPGVGVFYQNSPEGTVTRLPNTPANVNQLTVLNDQLVLIDNTHMYTTSDLVAGATSTKFSDANAISPARISFSDNSTYWLACRTAGILSFDKSSGTVSAPVTINSPKRNLTFNMTFSQGKLAVVGGGREVGTFFNNPAILMVMEANGNWINADENVILTAARNDPEIGSPYINIRDLFDVVIDPRDKDHYFVTTTHSGVLELKYDNNQENIDYVKLHNNKNTNGALTSIYPSNENSDAYVRMTGLTYDNKNNLYALNVHIYSMPIAIYSSDNKWSNYSQTISDRNYFPTQIYATKTNQKWVVNGQVHSTDAKGIGFFVLNAEDNASRYLNDLVDQEGNRLSFTFLTCVVEDFDGSIWAGTSSGPIIFRNPVSITEPDNPEFNRCYRIKVPRNDGTDLADYLLEGVPIKTIAVDGANRKWIGTTGAGVFLVSSTGEEVIANFTTDNSPLLSNTINKIVINDQTGEVFIATNKGLISYTNLATEGASDFSNVYAYPNPVRPDFIGEVVVTGLIRDSNVKVTDLAGNVMFQGISTGGQFSWNCRNRTGERVKSGGYLVMAATSDGSQGIVTKIVVVN